MQRSIKDGVCVSCGREPGRRYWTCPYCGERVWAPLWRRSARMVLLIVPPFVTAALLAAARPNWTDVFQAVRRMPPVSAFLFAGGLGLLLLPHATSDLITNSRRERARWNAQAVAGALLCGIYATATTVALAFGRSPNIRDWILAGSALGCIAAAPLFFRIPWRTLAAAALLVAAIALRQRLSGAG